MTAGFSRVQLVLIALCGLFSLGLAYTLFAPLEEYVPPPVTAAKHSFVIAAPVMFTPPPPEAFANIDERSVFNPLRVRVAPSGNAVSSGSDNVTAGSSLPSDLGLVGVIIDGQTRMAMLKSSASPVVVSVAEGGVIDGWRVVSVLPDKVVFTAGGIQQQLVLSDNKPSGAAQPSAKPAAGQL